MAASAAGAGAAAGSVGAAAGAVVAAGATVALGAGAVGLASAFIVALLVVKWLVGFVSRRGFGVFAWYRIGAGSLGLLLLMLGF